VPAAKRPAVAVLKNLATQLRIDSVRSTSASGTGHPTTCMSAAEIVSTLFFAEMRYDPKNPQHKGADRFVLSKGHAAPILYAAWAAAGLFPREQVMDLRKIESDLEGHPTPRLSFVDVATGSLGQGICAAIGTALNARRIGSDYRTYVLLGDGETAEGSVWEAAQSGAFHKLDNLCAITDANAFGQSRATQWGHDLEEFASRWSAFGWHTVVVDGHSVDELLAAYDEARATKGKPTMIVARTVKGKGVEAIAGKDGWHGKALKAGAEADAAIKELETQYVDGGVTGPVSIPAPAAVKDEPTVDHLEAIAAPAYKLGDLVATREAYGTALAALGKIDARVVALDSDVGNSTYSDRFEKPFPERFYQMFIAEQVMVGAAMGLAARGAIPFPSSFACFLYRAADFVRMAGISFSNVKLAGSHAGVSIGEDGPSQMALEDLGMFRAVPGSTVLYPSDAVCGERMVALAAATHGLCYIRTSRPKTPVIYANDETFTVGGSKTLRSSDRDVATVIGAGITVFEALKAYDLLEADGIAIRVIDAYSIKPIDQASLLAAARATNGRLITVEDHYAQGGLGDAVAEAVAGEGFTVERLCVREIPRSGLPDELIERYGISGASIARAVKAG
jgi:transketolase